ncbi:MAG: GtrA family protein [Clostridiales bacterium]|nr:GtrA family protein [Clostridiales bacterium]
MSTNEQPSGLKKLMQNKKFQEIFWYFVFGVLTTVVNLITFFVLKKAFHCEWPVKIGSWDFNLFITFINAVAWVVAVVFAYVTNKLYVFHTKGNILKEFIAFVIARLFTFFAFELGLFSLAVMVMENAMGLPQDDVFLNIFGFGITYLFVVKLFVAFFVVVANYIFSKIFIFKNPKDGDTSSEKALSAEAEEESSQS